MTDRPTEAIREMFSSRGPLCGIPTAWTEFVKECDKVDAAFARQKRSMQMLFNLHDVCVQWAIDPTLLPTGSNEQNKGASDDEV